MTPQQIIGHLQQRRFARGPLIGTVTASQEGRWRERAPTSGSE